MIAVILAAGVGSRLQPITHRRPKCMVRVAGQSILEHQVEGLRAAGAEHVHVVAGYMGEMVEAHCRARWDAFVTVHHNREFDQTNNMYSLYLVRHAVRGRPFLVMNGDVVFDPTVLADVCRSGESVIAADRGSYAEESMKLVVDERNLVREIAKTVGRERAYGNSIDLYRFDASVGEALLGIIEDFIERRKDRKQWTEVAIQALLHQGATVRPQDIAGRRWVEIDNYDDLSVADRLFGAVPGRLSQWRLLIVDLDGTVYVGDRPISGTAEWFAASRDAGRRTVFVTNNSSKSRSEYVSRLRTMGLAVGDEDVVVSTDALIRHLEARGTRQVYTLGTTSLYAALRQAGIEPGSPNPEFVVVGFDRELTYERLATACRFLQRGVPLLATHTDLVCPTGEGSIPDAGSILALLEAATGVKPRLVFGKPNAELVDWVIQRENLARHEVAVVGDRLYTDGELARRVGAAFVLVLSGETTRDLAEESDWQPDLILDDVTALR